MNLEDVKQSKLRQTDRRTGTARFHLHEVSEVAKLIETVKQWLPGAEGKRKWGVAVHWV